VDVKTKIFQPVDFFYIEYGTDMWVITTVSIIFP